MNNLIQINKNNQLITTSFSVAEVFERNHKDVLRCIKLLKCSKDFNERNFTPVTYKDKKGEKRICYEMTRDGWTFLVMSFTGIKAAAFKEKYIDAFNAMEAKLKGLTSKPVVVSEHNRALPSGRKEIVLSEKAKEEVGGIVKAVVHSEINKLLTGSELPKSDFWEVNDKDLIGALYNWHLTKNKKDTEKFQKLNATVDRLMTENAALKETIKNTKNCLVNW